jgi:hypothetical protein
MLVPWGRETTVQRTHWKMQGIDCHHRSPFEAGLNSIRSALATFVPLCSNACKSTVSLTCLTFQVSQSTHASRSSHLGQHEQDINNN